MRTRVFTHRHFTGSRPVDRTRVRGWRRSRTVQPTSGLTGGTARIPTRVRVSSPIHLAARVFTLAASDFRARVTAAWATRVLAYRVNCAESPTNSRLSGREWASLPVFGGVVGPRNWGPSKKFPQVTRCVAASERHDR